jgi:hypothetical protein
MKSTLSRVISLLSLLSFAGVCTAATLVDDNFTYADGALNNNAGWNGNTNSDSNFVVSGNELTVVQNVGGTFTYTINQTAFDFGTYSSVTASVDFSFTDLATRDDNDRVLGISIGDNTTNGGNFVAAYLRRGGDTGFNARLESNNLTGFADDQSAFADEGLLGLDYNSNSDLDSDSLRLSLELERGTDETDWTATVTVLNLTTPGTIGTFTESGFTTTADFFNGVTNGYAGLNTANLDVDSLTATNFTVTAIPEPSTLMLSFVALMGALLTFRRR